MLRVGLTGGIGAGKSTVARRLIERGAHLADADAIAREVVAPGEPALAEIADRFGGGVIAADGTLDRAALGAIVFRDEGARRDLEAITHPRIAERTSQIAASTPEGAVFVHDMPLLVEKDLASSYHLVVVVHADEQIRVQRVIERGSTEQDARARIAAQADDEARRDAADVWLENHGDEEDLRAEVDRLWDERLAPFAHNLWHRTRVRRPERVELVTDPTWAATGVRLAARVAAALRERALRVDHIGSTAVPGLAAKDVIDLQVGVRSLDDADAPDFIEALARAGYPRVAGVDADHPKDEQDWPKRFHGGCDPGQVVHLHVREVGSPGWVWALRFRDWLRADGAGRGDYEALKRRIAADETRWARYPEAKEPWFDAVHPRVLAWAEEAGWQPPAAGE